MSQNSKKNTNKMTAEKLELLVTIVGRNKAEFYIDLIQSFEVNLQASVLSYGTADAKMLQLLGLSNTEKSVIFSIIQAKKNTRSLCRPRRKIQNYKGRKRRRFYIAFDKRYRNVNLQIFKQ